MDITQCTYKRSTKGLTLVEILISMGLLGVILLAGSAVYVDGVRNTLTSTAAVSQVATYTAFEQIARTVAVSSEIQVTGKQLNLRMDVNNTPTILTDDTWTKFLIDPATNQLYRQAGDASIDTPVTIDNPHKVQPDLILDASQSSFTLKDARTVTVTLATAMGNPPKTIVVQREATAHGITF